MASWLRSAAGLIGGVLGGLVAGQAGAAIGYFAGRLLFGGRERVESGQLDSLKPGIGSTYGSPLPLPYGLVRVGGIYVWRQDYVDRAETKVVGAIFGFGGTEYVSHKYYGNALALVSRRRTTTYRRAWFGGTLIADLTPGNTGKPFKYGPDSIIYLNGSQTTPAHHFAAVKGDDATAWAGQSLIGLVDLPLTDAFFNRYQQIDVEVVNAGTVADESDAIAASGWTLGDAGGLLPDPSAAGYAFTIGGDHLARVYLPTQSLVWVIDWAHDPAAITRALSKYGKVITDLQSGSASDPVINTDNAGNLWIFVGNITIAGGWGGGGTNGIVVGFDRHGTFLDLYNVALTFQNNVGAKVLRALSTQIITWSPEPGVTLALLNRKDTWSLVRLPHGVGGAHSTLMSGSSDTETNIHQYAVDTSRNVLWLCGTDGDGFTRHLVRLDVGRNAVETHYLWHYTEGSKSAVYGPTIEGIWYDAVRDRVWIAHGGDTISAVDPENITGVIASYAQSITQKVLTAEFLAITTDPWLVLVADGDTAWWNLDRHEVVRDYETAVGIYDTEGQDGWNAGSTTHTRVRFGRVTGTAIAMSDFVDDVAAMFELDATDIDVAAVAGIAIVGYLATTGQTGSAMLAPPFDWYRVMMREHEFTLQFLPLPTDDTPVVTIAWDDLMEIGRDADGNPLVIRRTDPDDSTLPLRMGVTYQDIDRDHAEMTQYAVRNRGATDARDQPVRRYDIAATKAEAALVVQSKLERAWQEAVGATIKVPETYLEIEPGDVIGLPEAATATIAALVEKTETGADLSVEITASPYSADDAYPELATAAESDGGRATIDVAPVACVPLLWNAPALDGWPDDGFIYGVTPVRAGTVPGAQINRGPVGSGPSWTKWAVVDERAVAHQGKVMVAPADPDPWWERQAETIRVAFPAPQTLTDRTAGELYDSPKANLLWVGGVAGTGGELIQYEAATLVPGTTSWYDFTGLHRGRWFTNLTIGVSKGDAAVLVPESGLVRARESGTDTYGYAADTIGDDTEGPDRSVEFANANRSTVPATPNLLDAEREPDGDYRIRMVARDRLGWRFRSDGSAPPWTETEDIRVSIGNRTDDVSRDGAGVYDYTLSAAAFAAAHPLAGVDIMTNGDFDTPSATGWYATGTYHNLGVTAATSHSGTYSLDFSVDLAHEDVEARFDVDVSGYVTGAKIGVTAWARTYDDVCFFAVEHGSQTDTGAPITTTSWVEQDLAVFKEPGEDTLTLVLGFTGGTSLYRTVYADDIAVAEALPDLGEAHFFAQQLNGAVLGDALEVVV